MPNKHLLYACRKVAFAAGLAILSLANTTLSYDRLVNYTSTVSVNGFAGDQNVVWVASSGGLYRFDRVHRTGTLYTDPALFPDPTITSLCLDANHTLWIGTANGYLYKRPQQGRQTALSSYSAVGWSINAIISYRNYLIIGSNNGCSVFDTGKLAAVKIATGFGAMFSTSQVNAIAIFRDTLLLGCEQGVAKLYIAGKRFDNANFYDQSIWSADTANRFPVKSLVVSQDGYRALQAPGTMFNGRIITTSVPPNDSASGPLYVDSNKVMTLPSIITAITGIGGGLCCIGTRYNYFYLWNGSDTQNVAIDGPTFTLAERVYVDREGQTWVCPRKIGGAFGWYNPWWEGFSVFRNGRWNIFSPLKYSSMGPISGPSDIKGVCEDPQGGMWFGTTGGAIKRYDRKNDSWLPYYIGCSTWGVGDFCPQQCLFLDNQWEKCDAIACDSTGFLWFGSYNNLAGSLMCYDPRFDPPCPPDTALAPAVKHYRYFFPVDDLDHHIGNPTCLCVDAANEIIAGDGGGGNPGIIVLSHNGQPLTSGIQIKAVFGGKGSVFDAATTRDTLTYIATSTGFYTYRSKSAVLSNGLWVHNATSFSDTLMDSTLKGIRAVEMEDERIMWLGTIDSGLIRYDLSNNSKTIVDETQGLLSNHIWDLSIDRANGYLWIASERGVSRYALGYSVGKTNIGTAFVYPNPFSKRKHVQMVFEKLPPSSSVSICTVSGSRVATLSPEANSAYGSTCVWRPSATIVPGIYLYFVQSGAGNSRGKIIVTP
jgi:hypothetical protein